MAEIEFITKDPEQILVDTIALFQSKAGVILNDADPERILIDCMSYREVLLRNGIEWLMRQNFVQLADTAALDYWGGLFYIPRIEGEDDDTYRARILATNKSNGLGTKAAYKSRILSLADIADVLIFTKNDEPELVIGHVRVVALKKTTVNLIDQGAVHDAGIEAEIVAAVSTDDFGIIGATFEFSAAVPVPINGDVNVRALAGFDAQTFADNIEFQLKRYFGQLSLSFSGEFGIAALTTYLNNAEGLSQVVSLNFPAVPVLASGEFYQRGIINVNIE